MSPAARRSLIALCVLLALAGLLQPDRSRMLSATTFGSLPNGYGALFDLLTALGVPAARWLERPETLPAAATVWWIEPGGVCRPRTPDTNLPERPWGGDAWLAAGGTAVVFLGGAAEDCAEIAGVALPERLAPARDEPPLTAPARAAPPLVADPPADDAVADESGVLVDGPLLAAPRRLPLPALAAFAGDGGGEVLARRGADPFALAFAVGAGRLVLLADARPLRNRWLDRGDAAPLAIDLVRGFGTPLIDEYSHGMHRPSDAVRYLAASPALPALLAIVALGGLLVWHGRLWPARAAGEAAPPAPTLATFVDALGQLYARTGDVGRVAELYRSLIAAQLRRRCGLPPETPLPALLDRLRAGGRATPAQLAPLAAPPPVADPAALRAHVRALDALLEGANR